MRLIADIETNGLLRRQGKKPKATEIHCICCKDVDTGEVYAFHSVRTALWSAEPSAEPWHSCISDGLSFLEEADEIIGFNWLGYDDPCLKMLSDYNSPAKITDLFVMSSLLYSDMRQAPKLYVEAAFLEAVSAQQQGAAP